MILSIRTYPPERSNPHFRVRNMVAGTQSSLAACKPDKQQKKLFLDRGQNFDCAAASPAGKSQARGVVAHVAHVQRRKLPPPLPSPCPICAAGFAYLTMSFLQNSMAWEGVCLTCSARAACFADTWLLCTEGDSVPSCVLPAGGYKCAHPHRTPGRTRYAKATQVLLRLYFIILTICS